jgi:outer membrane lipoprotein carrier protein
MKKYSFLLFLFSFLMCSTLLKAQEDSDPKAKAILEKVRKKYEGYSNLEADFTLTMEVPGRSKEVQKGKMQQKGDKYHVNLDDQEVICDGKSTWIYLKKNKEVQVNDASASSDANSLSPKSLLKIYQNGNFAYNLNGTGNENGKSVQFIEVKPLDRNADYSKLRLAADKNNQITSLKVFNKDGSRYTLQLKKMNGSAKLNDTIFTFNAAQYPGVRVEDLRMN